MTRRSLLVPAALTALALPVSPAFAGEDPSPTPAPTPGSASLRVVQGCVNGNRAKAVVSGTGIDSVVFRLDGKVVKTASSPTSRGTFVLSMRCSRLSVGAHRGRAVVSLGGSTQTLRFQITRARQGSARFTG